MASKSHFTYGRSGKGTRRWFCLDCQRRVFYGDRCPECQRALRLRQRRKPLR